MFPPRLRTTANYSALNPQALACQTLPPSTSNYGSGNANGGGGGGGGGDNSHSHLPNGDSPNCSSLAAIFCSSGIVLFPTHAPYEPSLILSHHNSSPQYHSSSSSSSTSALNATASTRGTHKDFNYNTANYLSFSTQKSQHKLASTHHDANHSNTVLLWDTSGQSLQPLITRLSLSHHTNNNINSNDSSNSMSHPSYSSFIALDWNKHNDTIHTSIQNIISTWDLRTNTTTNNIRIRPVSTIITPRNTNTKATTSNNSNNNNNATIISITSSYEQEHEIACIDTNGMVHIYDDRMNIFHHNNDHSLHLSNFWAHTAGGIGIESIQLEDICNNNYDDGPFTNSKHKNDDNTVGSRSSGSNRSSSKYGYITWGLERRDVNRHYHGSNTSTNGSISVSGGGGGDGSSNALFGNSVKVWTKTLVGDNTKGTAFDALESYWYMADKSDTATDSENPSGGQQPQNKPPHDDAETQGTMMYKCRSEISVDNLSSVRICPKPFQGGIVTVSTTPDNNHVNWKVDLWRLTNSNTNNKNDDVVNYNNSDQSHQEFENMASFCSTDDTLLSDMIGRDVDGRYLIASELTLGSGIATDHTNDGNLDHHHYHHRDHVELTICCLDNAGYVTTYAIPEASSIHGERRLKKATNASLRASTRKNDQEHQFYFQRKKENDPNNRKRFQQSSSDPDLVSKNIVLKRGRGVSDADLYYDELLTYGGGNIASSAVGGSIGDPDHQHQTLSTFNEDSIEGGYVKIRMDDELFYHEEADLDDNSELSNQNIGNIQALKKRGVDSSQELDMVHADEGDERSTSNNKIDAEKAINVPCPRLCGATFGMGGGMVSFHNGEVKKMWNWFRTSVPKSQSANVRQFASENIVGGHNLDALQYFPNDEKPKNLESVGEPDLKKENIALFPRSLLGLMEMNDAAKYAQWGNEDEDSDGEISDSLLSVDEGDSSDECFSYGSSSTDDSGDVNDNILDAKETADIRCEVYFGKNAESYGLPQYTTSDIMGQANKTRNKSRSDSFLGPTTDPLVPVVFLTTKYDDISLNGQSPELASLWLLGPWISNGGIMEMEKYKFLECNDKSSKEALSSNPIVNTTPSTVSGESPGFVIRQYSKQDPSFQITFEREKKTQLMPDVTEMTHHNNEKDFFIPSTYTSSIPHHQVSQPKRFSTCQFKESKDDTEEMKTMIAASSESDMYTRRLNCARKICMHNGKAAFNIGQHRKADVWNLLAEVLDNMTNCIGDEFDGWKGLGSGSLGRNLVKEILVFFERQGDVQMLATIVSVIGNGRNSLLWRENSVNNEELLLPSDDKRCDIYIHLYANMLYSWGLIETSTELKKHLRSCPSYDPIVESGITVVPRCLECDKELSPNTKVCNNCNSYAFKCSICTNPVRGLFTVCFICGHGGHLDHVRQWFSENSVCPTGCGCSCIFINMNTFGGSPEKKSIWSKNQEVE